MYRICRSAFDKPRFPPALSPRHLENSRLFANRVELIKSLPKGGVVAEVGVATGSFSNKILEFCCPQMLHLVDLDTTQIDPELRQRDNVTLHKATSVDALNSFEDESFDWIYIDAGHSFEDVWADVNAASPKVKPGGVIVFNDFAHIDPFLGRYGVHRAACRFLVENDWTVHAMSFHPAALYDLAIRKPLKQGNP